jgi:hypothetical protein
VGYLGGLDLKNLPCLAWYPPLTGSILNDLYRPNGLVRGRVILNKGLGVLVQQVIKEYRPQHKANMGD